jgi:predicted ABC-type ATPase
MPNLYIISGCNGAGKTTASFTVLPEMLACEVFINADEIAIGRIMLNKIDQLISKKQDFAFETTLATKSYTNTIKKAKYSGYQITLVFFYLDSEELAIERVRARVIEGGHNIPEPIIRRRYTSGIQNLFNLYIPICDYWMIFNNSILKSELIAEGYFDNEMDIRNIRTFESIKTKAQSDKRR